MKRNHSPHRLLYAFMSTILACGSSAGGTDATSSPLPDGGAESKPDGESIADAMADTNLEGSDKDSSVEPEYEAGSQEDAKGDETAQRDAKDAAEEEPPSEYLCKPTELDPLNACTTEANCCGFPGAPPLVAVNILGGACKGTSYDNRYEIRCTGFDDEPTCTCTTHE